MIIRVVSIKSKNNVTKKTCEIVKIIRKNIKSREMNVIDNLKHTTDEEDDLK